MKYSKMNPDVDMNEIYRYAPDKVIAEIHNAFKDIAVFYNQPLKEETFKAYARRAMGSGLKFKAILSAIKRFPDISEKFPSYVQFTDLVRLESATLPDDKKKEEPRWIDEFKPSIDNFISQFGNDRFIGLGRAYLKEVFGFGINEIEFVKSTSGLYYTSALALYEWINAGQIVDRQKFVQHCKDSVERAVLERDQKNKDIIRKISENYIRTKG